MKVSTDASACISAGNCAEIAPHIFGQDQASGVVVALVDEVAPEDQDKAELAADVCPVAAIILTKA